MISSVDRPRSFDLRNGKENCEAERESDFKIDESYRGLASNKPWLSVGMDILVVDCPMLVKLDTNPTWLHRNCLRCLPNRNETLYLVACIELPLIVFPMEAKRNLISVKQVLSDFMFPFYR